MTVTAKHRKPEPGEFTGSAAEPRQAWQENSPARLLTHTRVLTGRILRRWSRDSATVAETFLVPIAFLVTLNIVLGDGISQVSGHSALYGSVPLVAMVAATQGATVGGLGIMRERGDGLLARLWVVPIHRAAGMLSRLAAEAVRIILATAVLMAAGLVLGLRFNEGVVGAIAWVLVPAVFGVAFAVAVMTIALYAANTIVVEATAVVSGLLMFFSTGFVPLDQYPTWIQPVVEHQPLSYTVEAMRGLSLGGPVLVPLTGLLLWSGVIIAVCAAPMAIGYRKASMRG